ncbi:MAG: hypothetical protein WDN24_13760 [Sphingomonas sp.]
MSRHPDGNGNDPRVIPFRPRKPAPRPPSQWRKSLILFAVLFALVAGLGALFGRGGLDRTELATAFVFALAVTGADILNRRRGLA